MYNLYMEEGREGERVRCRMLVTDPALDKGLYENVGNKIAQQRKEKQDRIFVCFT